MKPISSGVAYQLSGDVAETSLADIDEQLKRLESIIRAHEYWTNDPAHWRRAEELYRELDAARAELSSRLRAPDAGPIVSPEIERLVDILIAAAQSFGWSMDQGSPSDAAEDEREQDAARTALLSRIVSTPTGGIGFDDDEAQPRLEAAERAYREAFDRYAYPHLTALRHRVAMRAALVAAANPQERATTTADIADASTPTGGGDLEALSREDRDQIDAIVAGIRNGRYDWRERVTGCRSYHIPPHDMDLILRALLSPVPGGGEQDGRLPDGTGLSSSGPGPSVPAPAGASIPGASYQDRSAAWMSVAFATDPTDGPERRDRTAEEMCEGYQADGGTLDDWIAIGRYTFGRPAGELPKEFGQIVFTLACWAAHRGIDLIAEADRELTRCSTPEFLDKLARKRATRHGRGPLPGFSGPETAPAIETGGQNPKGSGAEHESAVDAVEAPGRDEREEAEAQRLFRADLGAPLIEWERLWPEAKARYREQAKIKLTMSDDAESWLAAANSSPDRRS